MAGLIDLDELALRCRDEQARQYIEEAVACYKAGAFRSCIVATWNAVVFDYLHKLRELEASGDKQAKKVVEGFEKLRQQGASGLNDALAFERDLIDQAATKFELFSPVERVDLERLRDDRNRCAHPSMQSAEDPYQPTAELARTHLRNAVEIMLQQEPVQGKSALAVLGAEVFSPYFPEEKETAIVRLKSSPIRRAKKSLIRNFLLVLAKKMIGESSKKVGLARLAAAFSAVIEMHREVSEEIIRNDIVPLVSNARDGKPWRLIAVCRYAPSTWSQLDAGVKQRIRDYIENAGPSDLRYALWHSLHIMELRPLSIQRLESLSDNDLAWLIRVQPLEVFGNSVVERYKRSGNFDATARRFNTLLLPMLKLLSTEQLRDILRSVADNGQIWNAPRTPEQLTWLLHATRDRLSDLRATWLDSLRGIRERLGDDEFSKRYELLIRRLESEGIVPP